MADRMAEQVDQSGQQPEEACIASHLKNYDFIRFTTIDLNGIPRSKMVPSRRALVYMQNGIYMYAGMNIFGANSQMLLPPEVEEKNGTNSLWRADISTLHHVSWVDDGRYKIGQVYVEPCPEDSPVIFKTAPRSIAKTQIKKLDDMGYELLSGMEWEYFLCDEKTKCPISEGHRDCQSSLIQTKLHSWFCDVSTMLYKAGVELDTMQKEYDYGPFEFNSVPVYGINSADGNAIMKQGIKEMAVLQGFEANFMARMSSEGMSNGAHFNFSIWDKKTRANAFYDKSGVNGLSSMAEHWIAGIITHAPALTALCCPTTICYQRLHQPWIPAKADWGINNRTVTLRVKNFGEKGTFMENRLPSSLANPYIVMAATLAAGMDGVINNLSCPEPEDESAPEIPHSLEEALQALQSDNTLVEALGRKFIDWFVYMKTDCDLKFLEGITDEKKRYKAEQELYARLC